MDIIKQTMLRYNVDIDEVVIAIKDYALRRKMQISNFTPDERQAAIIRAKLNIKDD